jgi:hypothetical protein
LNATRLNSFQVKIWLGPQAIAPTSSLVSQMTEAIPVMLDDLGSSANSRQAHTHFCPIPLGTNQLNIATMRASQLARDA